MPSAQLAALPPRGRRLGSQREPTCGTLFQPSYPAVLTQPSQLERREDWLWRNASKNFAGSKSFAGARWGETVR
jgi:hypothetical protein